MARLAIVDTPLDCSGAGRGEQDAPAALRAAGVVERLGARDAGEVDARIGDPRRDPETGVIGAADVRRASAAIAIRVRELLAAGECPVVIGGDCTLLLGVFGALPPGSGLWFVDGHADFYDGVRERGAARVGREAAARLARAPAWLHLDLDVLDEAALPAVSCPQPRGLDWDELVALARPLVAAPNLLGVSVADFNPDRDPGGGDAVRVVDALAALWA